MLIPSSMLFGNHIDGVFRDFYDQILIRYQGLTAETGLRLQTPGFVQIVLLVFLRLAKGVEALPDNDVARGACTGFLASMFDSKAASQCRIQNSLAGLRFNCGAFRANGFMG